VGDRWGLGAIYPTQRADPVELDVPDVAPDALELGVVVRVLGRRT
jgi:hypothetical protein